MIVIAANVFHQLPCLLLCEECLGDHPSQTCIKKTFVKSPLRLRTLLLSLYPFVHSILKQRDEVVTEKTKPCLEILIQISVIQTKSFNGKKKWISWKFQQLRFKPYFEMTAWSECQQKQLKNCTKNGDFIK